MRFVLLAALLLPLASGAQDATALTSKGNLLIGGSASLTVSEYFTSYGVSPRVGVFLADGVAVGARVSATRATFGSQAPRVSQTQLTAEPFVSYYFASPEASVQPFVSAAAGVFHARSDGSETSTGYTAEAAAGAMLRLGPNVGLTGEAYYLHGFNDFIEHQGGLRGGIAVFLGR